MGQQGEGFALDLNSGMGAGDFRRLASGPWNIEASSTVDGSAVGREQMFAEEGGEPVRIADTAGGTNNPFVTIYKPGLYLVTVFSLGGFIMPTGLDADTWVRHTRRLVFDGRGQDLATGMGDERTPEGDTPFFGPNDTATRPPDFPWASSDPEHYLGPSRSGYFASHGADVRLPASGDPYTTTVEETLTGMFYASESDKAANFTEGIWTEEVGYNYGAIEYVEEIDVRPPYDPPGLHKVAYGLGNGSNMYDPLWLTDWDTNARQQAAMQLHIVRLSEDDDPGALALQTTRKRAHRLAR